MRVEGSPCWACLELPKLGFTASGFYGALRMRAAPHLLYIEVAAEATGFRVWGLGFGFGA